MVEYVLNKISHEVNCCKLKLKGKTNDSEKVKTELAVKRTDTPVLRRAVCST
jgi:hypothetical protein